MNNVAFYFENSGLEQIDFREPLNGNPGSGATEFMTVLMASELSRNNVNVYLLSTLPGMFPNNLKNLQVNNIDEAFDFCARNSVILTIRAYIFDFEAILMKISTYKNLSVIIWAHLTPNQKSLKIIGSTPQIKVVVCLENNQRVRMADSLASSKLVTIPYGITGNTSLIQVNRNPNNVAFMGALVPQKGFHLLADAWPRVLKRIPDARLYVLGSGRLYDSRIELGPKGIATKAYEKRLFQELSKVEETVVFLGNADSNSRNGILETCRLGIVNPSARTETFCLSAVEFQQRGIPVIGGRKYGLLDTVTHGETGALVLFGSNLHKHIIRLLLNSERLKQLSIQAQNSMLLKYELDDRVEQWRTLIEYLSIGSSNKLSDVKEKMRVRSLQGVMVIANRPLVSLTHGHWPTGVAIWEFFKRTRIKLFSYRFLNTGTKSRYT